MSGLSHTGSIPLTRDQTRAVFGQVMGLECNEDAGQELIDN